MSGKISTGTDYVAVISAGLGIVGVVCAVTGSFSTAIGFGLPAVATGFFALMSFVLTPSKESQPKLKLAIMGLVCGVIAVVISGVVYVFFAIAMVGYL